MINRKHERICDHVAARLIRKGRYDHVERDVPLEFDGRMVYEADVMGFKKLDNGLWLLTPYEIKSGWDKPGRRKAMLQRDRWFYWVNQFPAHFTSRDFIYVNPNNRVGVERWRGPYN